MRPLHDDRTDGPGSGTPEGSPVSNESGRAPDGGAVVVSRLVVPVRVIVAVAAVVVVAGWKWGVPIVAA